MARVPRTLLLCALAALVCAAPAAAQKRPAYRGIGLTNILNGTTNQAIDVELELARRMGANTVRADVSWSALEPQAAGRLDPTYLDRVDHLMASASRRHLKVVLLLLRSPCWASAAPGAPGTCADAERYPPRHAADYGSIAGRLVARYRGKLAALEVWNEPDHADQDYFAGPDKPQRYAGILRAAYTQAKRADRHVPVLAGSLVGANGTFLRALYRAGIRGHYDGLAIHYYDLTLASIRSIRAVQAAAHDRTPVWLTEFGWTSCYPAAQTEGGHDCVTDAAQASKLDDVFRALAGRTYVRAAIVYTMRDHPADHFGMLRADGTVKPAFAALRKAFTGRLGRPTGLTAHVSGGVVRGHAPAGDVVQVKAFRGGRLLYDATLAPDRAGDFALTLPGAVAGATLEVSQPWTRLKRTLRA